MMAVHTYNVFNFDIEPNENVQFNSNSSRDQKKS